MGELFLNHGITTVFDLGDDTDWILGVRQAERDGRVQMPRIFVAGLAINRPGGNFAPSYGSGRRRAGQHEDRSSALRPGLGARRGQGADHQGSGPDQGHLRQPDRGGDQRHRRRSAQGEPRNARAHDRYLHLGGQWLRRRGASVGTQRDADDARKQEEIRGGPHPESVRLHGDEQDGRARELHGAAPGESQSPAGERTRGHAAGDARIRNDELQPVHESGASLRASGERGEFDGLLAQDAKLLGDGGRLSVRRNARVRRSLPRRSAATRTRRSL